MNDEKYGVFVDCLLNMCSNSDDDLMDTIFFDYTRWWTEIVNRGGIFDTNEHICYSKK